MNRTHISRIKDTPQTPPGGWKFELGTVVRVDLENAKHWNKDAQDTFHLLSGTIVERSSRAPCPEGGKFLVKFFHPPLKPWRSQDERVAAHWFDASELRLSNGADL